MDYKTEKSENNIKNKLPNVLNLSIVSIIDIHGRQRFLK